MKNRLVKELMVPISDYATIHIDASIADAIQALENKNKSYKDGPYRHQSLVVIDDNRHVMGRLSQVDIMRSFEPRYNRLGDAQWVGRSMLSKDVLVTLRESFQLWEMPLETMCQTVHNAKVKDYMQVPSEGEFVSETDTLNIPTHRIVMGHHHSLLVTRGKEIVGILRSTDLFNSLYDMMDACKDVKH